MIDCDHLTGRRVLIAGAGGFVGANFARTLSRRDAQTHCIVRPSTNLWRLTDIRDTVEIHSADLLQTDEIQSVVDRVEPEYVYHFASESGHPETREQRVGALHSTVMGTVNLLEAVSRHKVRGFIHIGSSLEYDSSDTPHRESDHLKPLTFRGATKGAATLLWQALTQIHDMPSTSLRLYTVYGSFEQRERFIPNAILAALHDGEIPITPPGYMHDRVFIEDVLEACILATRPDTMKGEVINTGTGVESTNEDVIKLLEKIVGKHIRVRRGDYPPRSFDRSHWSANIEKARKSLDWSPRHSLETGLQKTVTWFRENEAHYREQ